MFDLGELALRRTDEDANLSQSRYGLVHAETLVSLQTRQMEFQAGVINDAALRRPKLCQAFVKVAVAPGDILEGLAQFSW